MAWIKTTSEQDATGRLKEVYDSFHPQFPIVPNIMKSLSLKPEVLAAVARVFTTGTFGSSNLSRVQEEMIATVVSALNQCHY
jgi:alkylhydroperoxidase family enzyme